MDELRQSRTWDANSGLSRALSDILCGCLRGSPFGGGDPSVTDVEGSTRRWEADADAMRATLVAHDDVLRAAIEAAAVSFPDLDVKGCGSQLVTRSPFRFSSSSSVTRSSTGCPGTQNSVRTKLQGMSVRLLAS